MSDLVSTGIEGLDVLLGGGLRAGVCAVVQGVPGTGKTTIGLQFVHDGCLNGEAGVVVTFEQLPEQIYLDAQNLGWDLRALEEQDLLRVICTSPEVFLDQLSDADGMIDGLIREMDAKRMLVDSVSHLTQLASTPQELRSVVYGMVNGLKRARLTCMVTKEVEETGMRGSTFEEYLADTVISLSFEMGADLYRRRYLEVLKSRGQDHAHGKHTLKLGDAGAQVYPRRADRPHMKDLSTERISTGVGALDDMISSGIRRGHTVLVAGSAGVGKTTLGLSFVHAGAAGGEPAVYVSFEEAPEALLQLADNFGMALSEMQQAGDLSFMHMPPVHLRTDEFVAQLEAEIEKLGARRVVIDSITDLAMAGQASQRLRETVYIINAMFKQHGVTAILITEVPELFGQTYVTTEHVSIIVDGIILMKYLEMESEIQRAISVLKMRGCNHDKDIRRFTIQADGIRVESRFEGAEGVMAGSARPVPVALSVRSFTEIDEQHNQELMTRFSQVHPRISPVSISLPYNPDEARATVEAALRADTSELSVAPLCLYWMPEILQMNRLLPLDDLLSGTELEEHIPELLAAGTLNRICAIPALATCGVLLYRKDLLEEFGFDNPPQSWDELIHQAHTIVEGKPDEHLIGYQFPGYMYEGLTTSFLQNLWSNGAQVFDGEDVSLADESTLETLTYMHDLIYKERLVPNSVVTAAGGLEPQDEFIQGHTVFLTLLPSTAQAAQSLDSPVMGKVGITSPPMGPHGEESVTFLSGWLYGIPVGARAPQAAREFIRFMTSPQVQKERALRGGPLPTIEGIYTDPEVLAFNADYPKIRQMLRTAKWRSEIPQYPKVSRIIQKHLHAMLRGEIQPPDCLTRLKTDIKELV